MKRYFLWLFIFIALLMVVFLLKSFYLEKIVRVIVLSPNRQIASVAATVTSPFYYNFAKEGFIEEANKMDNSSSPYFWLNSGGQFGIIEGVGKTIQGELPALNKWRLAYLASNSTDTDNGYHPQNIFRLVTRSKWQDFQQKIYFKINKINLSASPNRNASNGVLFFNRYQDGNNLYYAGIRVDGTAVIKKKINGSYYTLAQKRFYNSDKSYNSDTSPNFIPLDKWIGIKSEIMTKPGSSVISIKFFIDSDKTGNWVLAVEAKDDGSTYGGEAILSQGYAGLRSDFMDVQFDDYTSTKI